MTTKPEDRKFRKATYSEQRAIEDLLTETLVKVSDGVYAYPDGWSDGRVGTAVHPDLSATHVQHIRKERFGKIVRGMPAGATDAALAARVTTLEAQVEALRLEVDALKRCRTGVGMSDKDQPGGDLLTQLPANHEALKVA